MARTSSTADTAPDAETWTAPDTGPDTGGAMYDAPNQQVVRGDGSGPWDEGSGGSARADDAVVTEETAPEPEPAPEPAPAPQDTTEG